MKNVLFRKMLEEDYPSVKKIYLEGIATGNATFQTDAPNWKDWDFSHLKHSRIIAEINGEIAEIFINNLKYSNLIINRMLGSNKNGEIAFFVDVDTIGYFKNIKITRK